MPRGQSVVPTADWPAGTYTATAAGPGFRLWSCTDVSWTQFGLKKAVPCVGAFGGFSKSVTSTRPAGGWNEQRPAQDHEPNTYDSILAPPSASALHRFQVLLFNTSTSFAQSTAITGTVYDASTKEALIGATILQKGTTTGTSPTQTARSSR